MKTLNSNELKTLMAAMFGEMLVKQLVKCYQLLQKPKNNKYYF